MGSAGQCHGGWQRISVEAERGSSCLPAARQLEMPRTHAVTVPLSLPDVAVCNKSTRAWGSAGLLNPVISLWGMAHPRVRSPSDMVAASQHEG